MRLIDADALKKHIAEIFEIEEKEDKKWAMGLKYSLKLIDNAPTVELQMGRMVNGVIVPIKIKSQQGKWIYKKENGYAKCPFCYHLTTCWSEEELKDYRYCYYCGADMRGGAEE